MLIHIHWLLINEPPQPCVVPSSYFVFTSTCHDQACGFETFARLNKTMKNVIKREIFYRLIPLNIRVA